MSILNVKLFCDFAPKSSEKTNVQVWLPASRTGTMVTFTVDLFTVYDTPLVSPVVFKSHSCPSGSVTLKLKVFRSSLFNSITPSGKSVTSGAWLSFVVHF